MHRTRSIFLVFIVAVLASTASIGQSAPADSPSHIVGILPFQDLSGDNHGRELKEALAKKLQAGLLSSSNLTPKFMKPGGDRGDDTAIDLQYAIKLARYYKTDIAILGSLVMAEVEEGDSSFHGPRIGGVNLSSRGKSQSATVVLQAEVIDVSRGKKLTSFRVTGKDRQTKVAPNVGSDYGSMNLSSGDFGRSALGKATQSAIDQMAGKILGVAAQFQPAGDESSTAEGGGSCAVLFRVVGPDMQPISNYTVAIGGSDMTSQVKNGVLRFSNPASQAVIQVMIMKTAAGFKTKPVYVGKVDGSCGDKTEKVFALELQADGEGTFSWW